MNIIICLDDRNGMMFNKRRQSRDKKVIQDIQELCAKSHLWMSDYSGLLFEMKDVYVTDNFLGRAAEDDYCFIESIDPNEIEVPINKIVVYRWNRVYPSDLYCTLNFSNYKLIDETEFPGSSHEKITRQIYRIKNK